MTLILNIQKKNEIFLISTEIGTNVQKNIWILQFSNKFNYKIILKMKYRNVNFIQLQKIESAPVQLLLNLHV